MGIWLPYKMGLFLLDVLSNVVVFEGNKAKVSKNEAFTHDSTSRRVNLEVCNQAR